MGRVETRSNSSQDKLKVSDVETAQYRFVNTPLAPVISRPGTTVGVCLGSVFLFDMRGAMGASPQRNSTGGAVSWNLMGVRLR